MDFGLESVQAQLDKLGKLPRAYRMAMLPALVVLVAALYVYFLYLPASGKLETARDQHLQLQRKLSEVRSVAANEEAVKEEIASLERKLAVALRQLPDGKELPVLLTDITSLGKNAGLEFKAFRPGEEQPRGFYAEVPIAIEFTGRFHDIAMFFDEVSRLPRIVNIADLDITIGNETSQDTMLKVKGNATTFRFIEGGAVAEPEDGKGKKGKKKGGHGKKRHGGGH
ncbi:MAG: type 4a pilus biogenesis protein PilO [Myxococcota bacterium]|nr:type 4a pilus biogenesis protein PilO [Myxococcota bacterium]